MRNSDRPAATDTARNTLGPLCVALARRASALSAKSAPWFGLRVDAAAASRDEPDNNVAEVERDRLDLLVRSSGVGRGDTVGEKREKVAALSLICRFNTPCDWCT